MQRDIACGKRIGHMPKMKKEVQNDYNTDISYNKELV